MMERRTERLHVRVRTEEIALIRRAADIRGMKLSAFVVHALLKVSRKIVDEASDPAPPVHTTEPVQEVAEKVVAAEPPVMTYGQWLKQAEARQRQAAEQSV